MTALDLERRPRRRPPTVGDVAEHAGVSVATVSRALRDLPNVAPATRERVLVAASELRYRADPHASRLATGRTQTVGIALPIMGGWYFSQVLAGAERMLAPTGHDLLVYSAASPDDPTRFVGDATGMGKRVDGLILVDLTINDDDLSGWADDRVNLVTVGHRTDSFPSVTIDDAAASAAGTRHLLNLGHREIGFIGGFPKGDDPFYFTVPARRAVGFRSALAEYAVTSREDLVTHGRFTVDGGREAMDLLLSAPSPPTAVVAISDEMAIGAIHSVRQHGLSVPDDISVIGFDDHDVAEAVGLTTIRQDVVEIGSLAARLLHEQFVPDWSGVTHAEVPTAVVVRDSTRPLR